MGRLNSERKPLTVVKYKELSGLTDLSDEEAHGAVHSLTAFAKLLYQFTALKKAA